MFIRKLVFIVFLLLLFLFPREVLAEKKIVIDLTSQKLFAYDGEKVVYEFIISTGKPWWPTPTGTFKPYLKFISQRMRGGNRSLGTYYDLSNVPYVVYFYKSYAIHGTYWHNNFGIPMSHGCVNVRPVEMEQLYPWIDSNTSINITGNTPRV